MNMIVAVDRHWGIGYKNRLLVSIPADMKFFRETTTGNVVVMGRRTLESFPNGLPLPNRTNIVLTRKEGYRVKNAAVLHTVEEALEALKEYPTEKIFVVGGESIYRQFLPYCDVVHVTKIDRLYQADAFFPDLDAMEEWELTGDSEEQTYFDLEYTFCRYERKKR